MIDPAEAEGGRGGCHGNGTPWFRNWFHGVAASLLAGTHARTHESARVRTCKVCGPHCDTRMSMRKYASSGFSRGICVSLSVWREKHCVKGQRALGFGVLIEPIEPFPRTLPNSIFLPLNGTRDLGWIEQLPPANRFWQLSPKWQRTYRNLTKQCLIVLLLFAHLKHHSRLFKFTRLLVQSSSMIYKSDLNVFWNF